MTLVGTVTPPVSYSPELPVTLDISVILEPPPPPPLMVRLESSVPEEDSVSQGRMSPSPAPWEPTVMYQVLSITTSVSIVTLGTTVPLWLVGLPQGPAGEGTTVQVLPKPPYNTSLTQVTLLPMALWLSMSAR